MKATPEAHQRQQQQQRRSVVVVVCARAKRFELASERTIERTYKQTSERMSRAKEE